jgi:DNA (cytosine-5)-methyltransferase 1
MKKHKVLDLFSGIGGFSLGLERTGGFETVAFCEIDKYCQKVLKKHWVDVPMYDDIKELTNDRLAAEGIFPTVLTAGFPCQDLSIGKRGAKGIEGERSGLFFEFTRLVREVRPQFCIMENVTTLLDHKNFSRVLGEFSKIGNYVVEWHSISAESIGARHERKRVWIVAVSDSVCQYKTKRGKCEDSSCDGRCRKIKHIGGESNAEQQESIRITRHNSFNTRKVVRSNFKSDFWKLEREPSRVVDGVSARLDKNNLRRMAIGNSLVPQIPEMIGNAILEYEKENQ